VVTSGFRGFRGFRFLGGRVFSSPATTPWRLSANALLNIAITRGIVIITTIVISAILLVLILKSHESRFENQHFSSVGRAISCLTEVALYAKDRERLCTEPFAKITGWIWIILSVNIHECVISNWVLNCRRKRIMSCRTGILSARFNQNYGTRFLVDVCCWFQLKLINFRWWCSDGGSQLHISDVQHYSF